MPNPFRADRLPRILRIPVGIALALALAELVVRQTYWRPMVQDPDFGAIVQPGATVRWTTEGDARSRWSERGIRRAELPPPGSRPILALGDSYTEGLMVGDEAIYTARLEHALGGEAGSVPVLNGGHSGASVADYVALAPDYRRAFSPRWTILQVRDGDFGPAAWDPSGHHLRRSAGGGLEAVAVRTPRGRFWALLQPLRLHSVLLSYGIVRFKQFAEAARDETPLFRAGSARRREAALQAADPAEIGAMLDLLNRAWSGRMTLLYLPDYDPHDVPGPSTPTEEIVFRICAERSYSCVSLRPSFLEFAAASIAPYGFPNSWFNRGHMNERGHEAAAMLLYREIEDLTRRGLL